MKQRNAFCLLLLLSLAASGCVRRRMTIRSNPAGATVYVDDQEIGSTPVSTPFVYYGTRKIQLVKDGHETVSVKHRFAAPWYQIPPLDFFSEVVWPRELRDERILDFELEPQRLVTPEELLERGQQLRNSSRRDTLPAAFNTSADPVAVPTAVPPTTPMAIPPTTPTTVAPEASPTVLPPAFYP